MLPPDPPATHPALRSVGILRLRDGAAEALDDLVAVESALELRVQHPGLGNEPLVLSTTMRTPGHDDELAAGYLYAENVIDGRADIASMRPCAGAAEALRVDLRGAVPVLQSLQRQGTLTSACGACGKLSAESLLAQAVRERVGGDGRVAAALLQALPARLRAAQAGFAASGGVHGVALFDLAGQLLGVREDVGRHNALDKLVGRALLDATLPWSDRVLLLSGRASFELLQKAARAGVSIVAAIGAPSSLAIDVARRAGITLVGFLSQRGFNVYAGEQRIDA